jgi:uncharacterized protein (TIGR02678 family)
VPDESTPCVTTIFALDGGGAAVNNDLLDGISEIDQANVVRCARGLLRRPLLRAGGADGDLLTLVYQHRAQLTELFAALLGYRLVVERGFARLYKSGPGADPTRSDASLSPRGYAYFALCLAVLTGTGHQTLLSRLVADIRAAAAQVDIVLGDDLSERRALVSALRQLMSLGIIAETDGSVGGLVGDGASEALITVDTTLLGQLVAGPLAEATSARELIALATRPGHRGVEHSVRRLLVEHPVTLYADLDDEQAQWLRKRARRESQLLERYFGLQTETREEGVAVTDPDDYLTDIVFPGQGTASRIALLALPELLSTVDDEDDTDDEESTVDTDTEPRADGRIPVTRKQVRDVCAELVERYPHAWSKALTENVSVLVDEVLRLWRALRLVTPEDTGDPGEHWLLSPAAHRWVPIPDDSPRATVEPQDRYDDPYPPPPSLFAPQEGTT